MLEQGFATLVLDTSSCLCRAGGEAEGSPGERGCDWSSLMLLFRSAIPCSELARGVWSSVGAESVPSVRLHRQGLASKNGVISAEQPMSRVWFCTSLCINCLLPGLRCLEYQPRDLVNQVLGFLFFAIYIVSVPQLTQWVKSHTFHQASGGSLISVRWCGEDETGWWAPWDVDLTVGLLPCPSTPIHSCVWSRVWARPLVVGAAWGGCRKEENLLVGISSPPCITV